MMGNLTKNFSLIEFVCRDSEGTPVPDDLISNLQRLADNLQILRDELGEPVHINSGYRTKEHNEAIGGEKNSYHMKAMAADITTKNKSPKKLKALIEKLIAEYKMKQGGIGLYNGFVHYDIRGRRSRW